MLTDTVSIINFVLFSAITGGIINAMYRAFYYDEVNGEIIEASKMVLWRVRYYFSKRVSKFYMKPIFTCVWCMASIYSAFIYFPAYGVSAQSLVSYLYFVPLSSFFAGLFNSIINDI